MVGYQFNTIGVSDGISMGTPGMSMSLQSRDLIADSIETVMAVSGAHKRGVCQDAIRTCQVQLWRWGGLTDRR